MQLAETYCTMASFAEHMDAQQAGQCSIELVRVIRQDYMHPLIRSNITPFRSQSLREAWDQSTDTRVAHTHELLKTLGTIVDIFFSLANVSPNVRDAWLEHPNGRLEQIEICQYRFDEANMSSRWSKTRQSELSRLLGEVIGESHDRFREGPSLDRVQHDVYEVLPSQSSRRNDRIDGKGKDNTKSTVQSAATSDKKFCVDLLRGVGQTKPRAKEIMNAIPDLKPPTVKTDGNNELNVCLRAMSSDLGKCGNRKCKLYHFPRNCSSPPTGVDISGLLAFLRTPEVKAKIELTDLGKKVLGSL